MQTRKRDCKQFQPGELVEGAAISQPGPNGKNMISINRIGRVLPIDKKVAARAFDSGTKISKFCATSELKTQYIYVDFTQKLNPNLKFGLGKSFEQVKQLKLLKKRGGTRKNRRN